MGDVAFAKQFLNTVDSKTTKYQPDHVFDPKSFQLRIPYTLPKLSTPPHPAPPKTSSAAPAPGSEAAVQTVSVTLKSARNPNMTLTLSSINPALTTIQSLKEQIQSYLGGPSVVGVDKIKVLLNKKPVPPSKKTIVEALDDNATGNVDFGVMIMGGAPDPPPQSQPSAEAAGPESEKAAAEAAEKMQQNTLMEGIEVTSSEPVQPGEASGSTVLESPAFWEDLQGFLEQRIRDQSEAQKLRGIFEKAWRSAISTP